MFNYTYFQFFICFSDDCLFDTFFKSQRRTVYYHKPPKASCRFNFFLSIARCRTVDSPPLTLHNCRLHARRACTQRPSGLAQAGGCDTVHAGHKRSCSHCTYCGVTPPLAPNRPLEAVHFVDYQDLSFYYSKIHNCLFFLLTELLPKPTRINKSFVIARFSSTNINDSINFCVSG